MELLAAGINQNFWIMVLIFSMIIFSKYRMGGITLAFVQAVFGFVPWVYMVVMIVTFGGVLISELISRRED